MSTGDPYAFWKQLNKAQAAGEQAKPAVYRIMDQFATMYDQLSNSSSLSPDSRMTETKMFDLSDKLNNGMLAGIQEEITGLLIGNVMQNYFSGGGDPASAQAQQQAQQEQIEAILDKKQNKIERILQMIARVMYENALADEQTKQLNKIGGSDIASIEGYSEEKIDAIEDLSYTVVMEPDDLEIA